MSQSFYSWFGLQLFEKAGIIIRFFKHFLNKSIKAKLNSNSDTQFPVL